jgi:hypothetical protein
VAKPPDRPAPLARTAPSPALVLLAAGLSTRFGRLKQLEPVGPDGEALLDYAIHDAVHAGFRSVVLVIAPGKEEAFREHLAKRLHGLVQFAFVHQALGDLPGGFRVPEGRTKPWGTGQAVLAAARVITGSFAACNADDFYGAAAYRAMYHHLHSGGERATAALVGYPLRATLSSHGGVSRAVCHTDAGGFLRSLEEVTELVPEGSGVAGRGADGHRVELSGDEVVSMNLWGITPDVIGALDRQFAAFLERHGGDPRAEFLLSTEIGHQVRSTRRRVRVLLADAEWFGMTHAADADRVRERLAELTSQGHYPSGRAR